MTDTGSEAGAAASLRSTTGREAQLDLLLAEELAVNDSFLRWFLSRIEPKPERWPTDEPSRCDVLTNVWDSSLVDPTSDGETDVAAIISWGDKSERVMLIENKINAIFQPDQLKRLRARADAARDPATSPRR